MPDREISRRTLLQGGAALAGAALLAGCGTRSGAADPRPVQPTDAAVTAAESRRRRPGAAVRTVTLNAAPFSADLGSRSAATWGYNARLPGPEIRVRAGDVLQATLVNGLPEPTSVHWHGLALRNDMDGVPGITQPPVPPGARKTYEFTVPDPGTYMFHSHSGVQLDRGLYGPLIVDDPAEPLSYDREFVVMIDDWTDGVGASPDDILRGLKAGSAMGTMPGMSGMNGMPGMAGMGAAPTAAPTAAPAAMKTGQSALLGGDAGDVTYPLLLINGRAPQSPAVFGARPGDVARFRIINPGADTAFRVALGGHRMTVTHTDGYPIRHVSTDALLVGMGERYDVLVRLGDGAFPLVAAAEGKPGQALAVVRTGSGAVPAATTRPAELDRRVVTVADVQADDQAFIRPDRPDRTQQVVLAGDMSGYRWSINGRTFDRFQPLPVREGERVRLVFDNQSMMFHPMHLHGHTFQVRNNPAGTGPRKDTVIVKPMQKLTVDLVADNPGQWLVHCHNAYHQEAGMATTLSYLQ